MLNIRASVTSGIKWQQLSAMLNCTKRVWWCSLGKEWQSVWTFTWNECTLQANMQRSLKLNWVVHSCRIVHYGKNMHESPHHFSATWFTLGSTLTKRAPTFTGKNFILHTILDKLIIAKPDKNPPTFLCSVKNPRCFHWYPLRRSVQRSVTRKICTNKCNPHV